MTDMGIEDFNDMTLLYYDYISECDELLKQISQKLPPQSQNEWIELEKDIHNIKGVSANLYVQNVFEKATILDDFLKQPLDCLPTISQFLPKWQELLVSFEQAKIEIVRFFKQRM